MDNNLLIFVGTGLFYLFIFVFGYWLGHSGKPYNAIIFTIHKLIPLAAIFFLVKVIHHRNQAVTLSTIELTAVVVTGLFFLGAIITGGLLSTDKPMPMIILRLHQIIPYLTVLSTAIMLYLLLIRK
jgi:hypothetical protein